MIAILLLALLQDQPVETSIEAFLKGDAAARGELMKLGVFAIRPLQKAREKSPEKIDALLHEIKKGVMIPADSKICQAFEAKVTVPETTVLIMDDPDRAPLQWEDCRHALPGPIFLKPLQREELKATRIKVAVKDRPAREILDQVFAQSGLDYAYVHNAVVLGSPDRLWPPGPPPKPRKLAPDEETRARGWIEKLADETVTVREGALKELQNLGPAIVPLLESNLGRREALLVSNCKALLQTLTRVPKPAFGPAYATLQDLDPPDAAVLTMIRKDSYPRVRLAHVCLEACVEILLGSREYACKIKAEGGKDLMIPMIDTEGFGALDMMSVLTQLVGLDFALTEGGFVIDTREALERAYPKRK